MPPGVRDSLGGTREVSSSRCCPGCARCLVLRFPGLSSPPAAPLQASPPPPDCSPAPFLGFLASPVLSSPPPPPRTASRARDCAAPTPFIPPRFPPSPQERLLPVPPLPRRGRGRLAGGGGARRRGEGVFGEAPAPRPGTCTRAAHLSRAAVPPPNAGARELSGITGVGRRRPRSLQPCRWTPGPGRAPLWLWPERARRLSNPPAPAAPARPALLPRSRARGGPVPSRRAEPGAAERPRRAGGFAHKSAVMMVVLMRPRSSPAELPRTAHEQQRRALPRARDSSTLLTGLGGDPGGQEFGRTLTRCPRWGSRARVTARRKAGSPAFTYCQATPQILIPHSDPKRCQAHTRRLLSSQEGSSEFGGSCPHSVS